MTNDHKSKERPLYRVTFSRILGQDKEGKDILSHPKEIGAAWPRKNGKGGSVVNFDIIPTDLVNRAGVIFLVPTSTDEQGGRHE